MTPRQSALLDLIKVTHSHARDHKINLEVAQFYLAAIDALEPKPDKAASAKPRT